MDDEMAIGTVIASYDVNGSTVYYLIRLKC